MSFTSQCSDPSYPTYSSDTEFKRQREVEQRFFRARGGGWKHWGKMTEIETKMTSTRTGGSSLPIDLTTVPVRIVIVAEAQINRNCFGNLRPNYYGYLESGSPFPQVHDIGFQRPTWITHSEKVTFSGPDGACHRITYAQKSNPHQNHKGDCKIYEIGNYADIWRKLSVLTNGRPWAEQGIAALLLRAPHSITAISAIELAATLSVDPTEILPEDVKFINTLWYQLFVKETARRQSPAEPVIHDVPWSSSIIRALKLVQYGYIPLKDVLDRDAEYGAFTGVNIGRNMTAVEKKIKAINRKYLECFPATYVATDSKDPTKFGSDRRHMRRELADTLGGASDTDESGYESPSPI